MVALRQTLHRAIERHPRLGKVLLGCGVVSSVWWAAMDTIGSLRFPGYSYLDQTISELSAEGAPTRTFLVLVNAIPYSALVAAFGIGLWAAAGQARVGHIVGALLVGDAAYSAIGWLFPMMQRGAEGDLRNAIHAPYGALSIVFFLLIVGYGSRLLGRRFHWYSYATIATTLLFGVLMGMQSGRMVAGEPTPWMGLEERICVYATMLWIAALAIALLRAQGISVPRMHGEPAPTPLPAPR